MNENDIPLKEAMFAWNWDENQNRDGIDFMVVRHPDRNGLTRNLTCTYGACNAGWRGTEDAKLLSITIEALWVISVRHGIKSNDIHKAMLVVPEYRKSMGGV